MMRLPPSSTRTGTLLPYATLCRSVGTAGLASLLTAPASSLPLATTVFVGGSTGAGACCRQPAGSRQAIARQDSNDGKRNRAGITTWGLCGFLGVLVYRSEEHTSELQSLMRISYAVFFLHIYTPIHFFSLYCIFL